MLSLWNSRHTEVCSRRATWPTSPHVRRDSPLPAICLMVAGLLATVSPAGGDDWTQFRGPNSSGVATTASIPLSFGPDAHVHWKAAIGPGHSSPCVADGRIYLTSFASARSQMLVHCLSATSGEQQWQHAFTADQLEKGHPSFNPASSSPACDGEVVVAYFGSLGLVALRTSGELLWERRMPTTKSFGGNATSPIIAGDLVILYRGNYLDHNLLAFDRLTGEERWRVPQSEKFTGEMACTACPIVVDDKLIVHSARSVQCFDVHSGELIWLTKCATTATSTPIVVGDDVVVAAWNKMGEPALRPPFPTYAELLAQHDADHDGGISKGEFPELWIFHRPDGMEAPMNGGRVRFNWADRDKDQQITATEWAAQRKDLDSFRAGYETHGLLAIPLNSAGILKQDEVRTLETQGIPEVPSPVSDGRYIYLIKNGGILTVIEQSRGKRVSRVRTPGRGTHYASPIIAGDHLLTVAGDGVISVLTLGSQPEVVATNRMGESVYASPVVLGDTLLIRTHSTLYAFRSAAETQTTSDR